ncbi:MAG: GxxExxY protein [Pirellulales bacterium]
MFLGLTVHPNFEQADEISRQTIAAAIEVHRTLGSGLLESIYEWAMTQELALRGLRFTTQKSVLIRYKNATREECLSFDLLVEDCVLVEIKAVERTLPIHKAQLFSYLKLLNRPIGLLMNFHETRLVDGLSRIIYGGDSTS